MCLILFAHQHNEQYKLVLIANRDEYHHREAKPAAFWPQQTSIFGGIDCSAGGSWLSIDKTGRLAAITNIRKPPFSKDNTLSRGEVIANFLSQQQTAADFLAELTDSDHLYGLFNLLLLDDSGLWHYSSDTHRAQLISPGIHGLSNACLGTPWPKVSRSCAALESQLQKPQINEEHLLNILQSSEQPAEHEIPVTGIDPEFERLLSSAFIQSDDYGTRCSTLITIDHSNRVKFTELTYNRQGEESSRVQQTIQA
ncbi:MAG: NRDE family protein [Cycloclasticus sp.]